MKDDRLETLQLLLSSEGDWPSLKKLDATSDILVLDLHVPENLACFAGHFPEQAVLPGVLQLLWVCQIAESVMGYDGFSAVKNIKYNNMILPDTDLQLQLQASANELRFSFDRDGDRLTSGSLRYQSRMAA